MNIKNLWPFKKSLPIQTKAAAIVPVPQGSMLELALSGGSVSAAQAYNYYRTSAAVGTAIDIIGDSFKQITPVIKKEGDTGYISNHPVLELLKSPNDFMTDIELAERISKNLLITGDSHLAMVGNVNRPPIEVYPVKGNYVIPQEGVDKFPDLYMVTQGKGVGTYKRNSIPRQNMVRFYAGALQEIYHIKSFCSGYAEVNGDSLMQSIALEVKQQIHGMVHNLQVLNNGGRLSLVVTFKDTYDAEEHKEKKEMIWEQFGGSVNAGQIGVISSQDMTIEEFGKTNKDMDFKDLQAMAELTIYKRYKVPLPLVTTDASTFNNYTTAIEALYDFAVLPHADFIFSGLTRALMPRYGLNPFEYRITYNPDSITALMDRRLKQLKERKEIGVESVNELRSHLPNRGEVEGGEHVFVPLNSMPIQVASEVALARVQPRQQAAAPEKKKRFSCDVKLLPVAQQKRTKEEETAAREKEADKHKPKYQAVLSRQQSMLFDSIADQPVNRQTILAATNTMIASTRAEMSEAIKGNYLETGPRWAAGIVVVNKALEDEIGDAIADTLADEGIILTEISMIESGTTQLILEAIDKAINEGGTIADVQDAIMSAGVFDDVRALRIARTVTGSAASLGQLTAGEGAGATKKTWLDSGFGVRDEHRARNGETVDVKGRFSSQFDGSQPRWPGDPEASAADRINCRCSLTFEA